MVGDITSLMESITFPLHFGYVSLDNSLAVCCLERIPTVWALFWVWGSGIGTQTGAMVP